MAKNRVKQIVIKTVKPQHLHTCNICGDSDVWVSSKHLLKNCNGNGIAKCQTCKSVREF